MSNVDIMDIRCRHKLPNSRTAGFGDIVNEETGEVLVTAKELLLKQAKQYPHLRPCPKYKDKSGFWEWTYREYCRKCINAVYPKKNNKVVTQ